MPPRPSRRELLVGSAAFVAATALTACSRGAPPSVATPRPSSPTHQPRPAGSSAPTTTPAGSASTKGDVTTPLARPRQLTEAPTVKQLMGRKYVPVDQRVPANPYVVPHRWVRPGKYGGTLNMTIFSTTGADAVDNYEYFYGFSPWRFLNDGLDLGPGCADKLTSNADTTEWVVHFRDGLKWSDGVDFDVADVLFWYNDIAVPGHDGQTIPPGCISAKNHPCKMSRTDQYTLTITYDSPQPLVADYLAAWVKGNIGKRGPAWIMPKHYGMQFHPKYNPKVPKNWDIPGGLWEQKMAWIRNPECPTLVGYTCEKFDINNGLTLRRNPYYYAVMPNGDQLPYIDKVTMVPVQSAQVIKLQVQQGKVDFCYGYFNQLLLSDISALKQSQQRGHYNVLLWDSGSGTGSTFFVNYDYVAKDPKYGKVLRTPQFRQAISCSWDRATLQKTQYFETGETTTGTMSPKAIEFHTQPDGPSIYAEWRDSYKDLNVEKAQRLFEQAGLKKGADGTFTFADGSPFTLTIAYSADLDSLDAAAADLQVANLEAAGLHAVRQPISPVAFGTQWSAGLLMSQTNAGVSDGPNCLFYPQWLVPLEASRWAPLEGMWEALTGQQAQRQQLDVPPIKRNPPRMAPDPGGTIERLEKLYRQAKLEPDTMRRHQLVWQMLKVHIQDGPFFIGTVASFPKLVVPNVDLRNIPTRDQLAQGGFVNPATIPSPAVYDPESWYWEDPLRHA